MNNNFEENNNDIQNNDVEVSTKKTKRTIIIAFASMLAFMIICLTIPGLTQYGRQEEIKDPNEDNSYFFCEPYEKDFDILEYEEYLGLDRTVMYYDGTGIGSGLVEGNLNEYNPGVTVIYNMLNALIEGDVEAYNSLLGENMEKKESFTQQQIYKISITNKSKSSSDGTYEFTVDYKIHENNGSYRKDMGSDMYRPLAITVSNVSGQYLIESMSGIIYN